MRSPRGVFASFSIFWIIILPVLRARVARLFHYMVYRCRVGFAKHEYARISYSTSRARGVATWASRARDSRLSGDRDDSRPRDDSQSQTQSHTHTHTHTRGPRRVAPVSCTRIICCRCHTALDQHVTYLLTDHPVSRPKSGRASARRCWSSCRCRRLARTW